MSIRGAAYLPDRNNATQMFMIHHKATTRSTASLRTNSIARSAGVRILLVMLSFEGLLNVFAGVRPGHARCHTIHPINNIFRNLCSLTDE